MTTASVVIVGAGAAGTAAATQLRDLGFAGDLTLVNAEGPAPYNRTTVNKTLLHPAATLDSVRTALPNDPHTNLLAGRAERLDTERRTVVLQDGNHLSYDAVLIASGARSRLLPGREQNAGGLRDRVTPLRIYDDADRIRRVLAKVGATNNPMTRQLGTTIATWVGARHAEHLAGVLNARVDSVAARGDDVVRTISHHLQRTEDPGPFQPSGSYSTRLYGKSINVLGSPHPHRGREVALAPPGHEAHVTVYTSAESRLIAAVTLGSAKLANRLRPLVAAGAALAEAADVVTATLTPSVAGR